MEEKKLDHRSAIGVALIAVLLGCMLYNQVPTQEELDKEKAEKEKVEQEKVEQEKQAKLADEKTAVVTEQDSTVTDSVKQAGLRDALGAFAYSASLPSAKDGVTELKNDKLLLEVSNKGGYISVATPLGFEQFSKDSGEMVKIIKDNNADFNLQFKTKDNRILNTRDMYFEPVLTKNGENQVLTMRLKAGANAYLEYRYEMTPGQYMVDFSIRTQGLSQVLDTSNPIDLEWKLKTYRNE